MIHPSAMLSRSLLYEHNHCGDCASSTTQSGHGDECVFNQRAVGNFARAFGDGPDTRTIVGLADTQCHVKEGGGAGALSKAPDIEDGDQQ